jgi:hypothetical protein
MSETTHGELSDEIGTGQEYKSQEWHLQARGIMEGKSPRAKSDQELPKNATCKI